MSNANIVTVDWAALSLGERIRYVEVEGYVVLPNLLSSEHIARLKAQTAKLETKAVDYSIHQQIRPNIQLEGGAISWRNMLQPVAGLRRVVLSYWVHQPTPEGYLISMKLAPVESTGFINEAVPSFLMNLAWRT